MTAPNLNSSSYRESSSNIDDQEYLKLWGELTIQLNLEGQGFPDDKIYGRIDVNPPTSRRLIKTFRLVIDNDKKQAVPFAAHSESFSASGFNHSVEDVHELYIEAIPKDRYQHLQAKESDVCSFFFNGARYTFNPKLSFEFENVKGESIPILAIRWNHIGDELVHKYLLYLDGKEIHQISFDAIKDTIEVLIDGWDKGAWHSLQLVGILNHRKETYRSDLLTFVVPDQPQEQIISVSEDSMPENLAVLVDVEGTMEYSKKSEKKMCSCGLPLPHDTFPGIEHYFKILDYQLSSKQK